MIIIIIGARYAFKNLKPSTTLTEGNLTGAALSWEELTGMETTWIVETWTITMQELTGEFDSWEVPTVKGSETVDITTGATADVKNLIEERKSQPADESKLTEEDIGLMEKIIERLKNLK